MSCSLISSSVFFLCVFLLARWPLNASVTCCNRLPCGHAGRGKRAGWSFCHSSGIHFNINFSCLFYYSSERKGCSSLVRNRQKLIISPSNRCYSSVQWFLDCKILLSKNSFCDHLGPWGFERGLEKVSTLHRLWNGNITGQVNMKSTAALKGDHAIQEGRILWSGKPNQALVEVLEYGYKYRIR